MDPGRSRKEKK